MAKKLTKSSSKYISEPGEYVEYQSRLHHAPGFKQSQLRVFPPVSGDVSTLREILATGGYKGNDWEFRPDLTPTICAVTTLDKIYSAPWSEAYKQIFREAMLRGVAADGQRYRWVAHSTVGADKAVADKVFGITTNLDDWDDSMISHYLANQHLVKAPDKDESDDVGSLGFLDLWSTASLVTDLSRWKGCRGAICPGPDPGTPGYSRLAPCPTHSPMSYCGVDAWVSPVAHLANMETLKAYGVPDSFYRDMMELSEICYLMQQRGVKVDRPYVAKMSLVAEEKKAALFPVIAEGRHKTYAPFNPRSNPQVIAWFKERKVTLKKIDKAAISEALNTLARAEGFPLGADSIGEDAEMSEALTALYNLNTFKTEGKGLDPWFHEKYLDEDGFAHPRFILTGTSTGRLSSSGPNFQNIPRKGVFGKLVRGAIIPRDESLKLLKSDFCVAPGTKILTKDLRWVPVETLQIGDDLIGFDEVAESGRSGQKLKPSKVLANTQIARPRIKVVTNRGSITVSEDHRFIVRRKKKSGGAPVRHWIHARDLVVGDNMAFTKEPWEFEDSWEAGWLSGFFDGEGWVSSRHAGVGQRIDQPCLQVCLDLARKHDIPLTGGAPSQHKNPKYLPVCKYNVANIWDTLRLLGKFRPSRLLAKADTVWHGARTWGKKDKGAQILSIERLEPGPVYALETSTKTYISNGFLSHNCQLELRTCLYLAGEPYSGNDDAFNWLVAQTGDSLFSVAKSFDPVKYAKDPLNATRDITKGVVHGGNYGEGMVLLDPKQLNDQHILKLVAAGALSIYTRKYKPWLKRDWTFHGKVVAFTGANLAERLFGSRSVENRAKALAIQEDIYFARFRAIREWQIRVLDKVQETGYVQSPTGRFLRLHGTPEEIAKVVIAFLGQGVGADHVQAIMLRFRREQGKIPILQVHDELVFEQSLSLTKAQSVEYIKLMEGETNRLPGFTCPVEAKWGPNWKDMDTIYKNGEMVQ